jgi:hypothetical protein
MRLHLDRPGHGGRRAGGWSTVELMIAITVMVLGVLSLAAGFQGAAALAARTRENLILHLAYRNIVGELQAAPFSELTTDYGPGSGRESFWLGTDDPASPTLGGIVHSPPRVQYAAGSLAFYATETEPPSGPLDPLTQILDRTTTLVETALDPIDLNLDGRLADGASTDYRILPVRIKVAVIGGEEPRTLVTDIILKEPGSQ